MVHISVKEHAVLRAIGPIPEVDIEVGVWDIALGTMWQACIGGPLIMVEPGQEVCFLNVDVEIGGRGVFWFC